MLKCFEVKNFKNFNNSFVCDLSETKNYTFNENCINNDLINTGIIYGPNGCGKSNLGYAIFDITTHLTDKKIDKTYLKDYLNAENDSDVAEFKYTFQFGTHTIEYSYGKFSVSKFAYEYVKINDKLVVSFDRRKENTPKILLEGTEQLNKNVDDNNLSIVKYISANSIFKNSIENVVFYYFNQFVIRMRLIRPTGESNYIGRAPEADWLDIIINEENNSSLKDFEHFINKAGIKCKLAIAKNIDEDRLVFDFGKKKIDFTNNASSGTQVLTGLYIELILLRFSISTAQQISKHQLEKLKIFEDDISKLEFRPFIFVDEFDAYYNHELSELVVRELRDLDLQAVLTTHNTTIMTNDLLRPDCYFTIQDDELYPIYKRTNKELRKAHSLEKMYRAGSFNE